MAVYINGKIIGNECYPNNERIYKEIIPESFSEIMVELKYETDIDLMVLQMVKQYLDDVYPNKFKYLMMKYVPYSRMDRKIDGYMFSLKYFANIINSMDFDSVLVFDVHSKVTKELINNVYELTPIYYVSNVFKAEKIDYVLYPDKGAMSRYSEMFQLSVPYFNANKKRDLNTGKIIGFELENCPDIKDKNILIIDDLCAKGGTFMASAQLLKDQGAKDIFLYVSHCENTIFNGEILKSNLIKKVYTANNMFNDSHEKIIIIGD
jgi:ribose-phosphate pyrophosphokinase